MCVTLQNSTYLRPAEGAAVQITDREKTGGTLISGICYSDIYHHV